MDGIAHIYAPYRVGLFIQFLIIQFTIQIQPFTQLCDSTHYLNKVYWIIIFILYGRTKKKLSKSDLHRVKRKIVESVRHCGSSRRYFVWHSLSLPRLTIKNREKIIGSPRNLIYAHKTFHRFEAHRTLYIFFYTNATRFSSFNFNCFNKEFVGKKTKERNQFQNLKLKTLRQLVDFKLR